MTDNQKQPIPDKTKAEYNELNNQLDKLESELEKLYAQMKISEEELEVIKKSIQENRQKMQDGGVDDGDIKEIEELMQKAQTSMDEMDEDDLYEIASYRKPSERIRLVIEAVVFVMTGKKMEWKDIREEMADDFVDRVMDIKWSKLKKSTIKTLEEEYFSDPLWDMEKIHKASKALGPLAEFMKAKYEIRKKQDKQEEDTSPGAELKKENKELGEEKDRLENSIKKNKKKEKAIVKEKKEVEIKKKKITDKYDVEEEKESEKKIEKEPVKEEPVKEVKKVIEQKKVIKVKETPKPVPQSKKDTYTIFEYERLKRQNLKINLTWLIYYDGRYISIDEYEKIKANSKGMILYNYRYITFTEYERIKKENARKGILGDKDSMVYFNGTYITVEEYERIKQNFIIDKDVFYETRVFFEGKYISLEEYEKIKKERGLGGGISMDQFYKPMIKVENSQAIYRPKFQIFQNSPNVSRIVKTQPKPNVYVNTSKPSNDNRPVHTYGRRNTDFDASEL